MCRNGKNCGEINTSWQYQHECGYVVCRYNENCRYIHAEPNTKVKKTISVPEKRREEEKTTFFGEEGVTMKRDAHYTQPIVAGEDGDNSKNYIEE